MVKTIQVVAAAALLLAVPALAVCAFAQSGGEAQTVAIAAGDDAVANGFQVFKQPAQPSKKAVKAGQTSVEVMAQEWVSTGPGKGGGGSPKK